MAWGKVDDRLYSSPKWLAAKKPARALWVTALSWSMDQLTDGHVPAHVLAVLDGTRAEAADLVRVGLWHTTDDGWVFHDWSDYQPSRAQVLAERDAAKKRQRRAREKARESRTRHAVTHTEVPPGVTVPPTRPLTTTSNEVVGDTSDAAASDGGDFTPDVHRLTNLLAELVRANGHKANPTKQWLTACDRLMRLDGYTPEQVEWVMRWATTDEFWAANIRSMPTLREKFSQLAHRARQEHAQAKGRRAPAQDVADILALGERMQAQLEGRAS